MSDDTLERAKIELRQNWENGCDCPCCGQFVKKYRRKISGRSVASLIRLVNLYLRDHQYHHVEELGAPGSGGDFARLERYGLIHAKTNEDSSKRTSGQWMPTNRGCGFVRGELTVPSHIRMFNGITYGFEGDDIDVKTALGNKFDYAELMGLLV